METETETETETERTGTTDIIITITITIITGLLLLRHLLLFSSLNQHIERSLIIITATATAITSRQRLSRDLREFSLDSLFFSFLG